MSAPVPPAPVPPAPVPPSPVPPAPLPSGGDLHGRPTASELVDAVLAFARDQLPAHVDDAARHQVRIAVRALEIVARQLELGPQQEAAHQSRLLGLGYGSDAGLAQAIRDRRVEDSEPLRQALVDDTRDRLLVANPGWLTPNSGTPDS